MAKRKNLRGLVINGLGASFATRLQWRSLMPLILATVFLAFALFFIGQIWLVMREQEGLIQAREVRVKEVAIISKLIADTTLRVQAALNSPEVYQTLTGFDEATNAIATAALKQIVPEVKFAEFYNSTLDEILTADPAKFGYAKAAMLLQTQSLGSPAPAQMQNPQGQGQSLALALPVKPADTILAYAYVQLPFDPVIKAFQQAQIVGARLDLRQGDGRGDLVLASIGESSGNSLGDVGDSIPGTSLRVSTAAPDYFIVFTDRLWLLWILMLFCLAGGIIAMWIRWFGIERAFAILSGADLSENGEMTLAEALQQELPQEAQTVKPVAAKKSESVLPKPMEEATVSVDRSIFRMYDIRGVVATALTPTVVYLIGRAIGSEARERGLREIVVGRDGRLSGPDLVSALIDGLRATGCDVIDIGAAPTPVVYFATYHLNTGSGIAVTGSHNPPEYNGLKIVLGGQTLAEDAIQNLYARISEGRFTTGNGGLQVMDISRDYIERITSDIQVENKLKIVVDCGNGIPGAIAPSVLEGVGCEVIPLYCEVDGNFPNHHPDPSDPENLKDLILSVKQTGADLGLAFDGDGDRLGVVTKNGEIIFPDRLLMLFAMDVLTRNPGAAIIYDVKCTGHLQALVLAHGGSPIMWRTGHSLIKAKMREIDAALAGEMSGHFFFQERWFGFDDAIYAAARLLEIVAGDLDGRSPQEIFDALPKGVSTPELKVPMEEGEHYRFVENFKQKAQFEGARLTMIDGVRADWADGWGLVRASNTTPVLVLRFDADNKEALRRIQEVFRAQMLAINANLVLPF